ncbi:GNAT family N-acetyltransferase [Paenibacillus chartarius]|uniref:GNAT family N-acetyltransferase n=1 Tax=Paenibacillus chartarius TaxID=747481 RepID=A0ABV6DMC6_9BACL
MDIAYIVSIGGLGYASEAAYALCKFGFTDLRLHRIFATCRPENAASSRVMEKIGMTQEGMLREHLFFKGKWHSSFGYSIQYTANLGIADIDDVLLNLFGSIVGYVVCKISKALQEKRSIEC